MGDLSKDILPVVVIVAIIILFVGLALAARGIAALEQDNARLREACGVKDGAQ